MIGLLYFLSGCPALVYQLVWQRALFRMFGVHSESITVVVTAFLLGLGLGGLFGGWLSVRTRSPLLWFGLFELAIAAFAAASLPLFDAVGALTLGAAPLATLLVALLLVLVPTLLMGATLPLLTAHLVASSRNVGRSVGLLSFVNTLGSGVACFAAALWMFGPLGMTGSVRAAACVNAAVGIGAIVFARRGPAPLLGVAAVEPSAAQPRASVPAALALAALSGFLALSWELVWIRGYSYLLQGIAASFALVLGSYLCGIAVGALASRRFCERGGPAAGTRAAVVLGILFASSGVAACAVVPLLARAAAEVSRWTLLLGLVFGGAVLQGGIFPLIAHVAVRPDARSGAALARIYLANILGSAAGCLLTGFVLMDVLSLRALATGLALVGVFAGGAVLLKGSAGGRAGAPILATGAGCLLVLLGSGSAFDRVYERLLFKDRYDHRRERIADLVETRGGVVAVIDDGQVFGSGTYDGAFNVDLVHDVNQVVRAYSTSLFHPAPRDVLVIGLASGSWVQVLAHHPQVERVTAVEIDRGYLELIGRAPEVASILSDPKVELIIDDGRRFLARSPERAFDYVVMNCTFHWRAHASNLLSREFLELARSRLRPGGVLLFNHTWSDAAQKTALEVFCDGWRVRNFMVVSDAPLELDGARWRQSLLDYRLGGRPVLDPARADHARRLDELLRELATAAATEYDREGLEPAWRVRARTAAEPTITDDNMGAEWDVSIPAPLPPRWFGLRAEPAVSRAGLALGARGAQR